MELYAAIVSLLVENLIKGIFLSVMVIILAKKLFKGKINTDNAVSIIKWMLIGYAILTLLLYIMLALSLHSDIWFKTKWERANGQYRFAFWLMVGGSFSSLLLFIGKLGRNLYWVLLISILVNIGWVFESLVIHFASYYQDYPGSFDETGPLLPFTHETLILVKGFVLGLLVVTIGNLGLLLKRLEE